MIKILIQKEGHWLLNGRIINTCYDLFPMEKVLVICNIELVEKLDEFTAFVRSDLNG